MKKCDVHIKIKEGTDGKSEDINLLRREDVHIKCKLPRRDE